MLHAKHCYHANRINQPDDYYQELFNNLNGLVFPGGSAKLGDSGYYRASKVLWDLAADQPDVSSCSDGLYRNVPRGGALGSCSPTLITEGALGS